MKWTVGEYSGVEALGGKTTLATYDCDRVPMLRRPNSQGFKHSSSQAGYNTDHSFLLKVVAWSRGPTK